MADKWKTPSMEVEGKGDGHQYGLKPWIPDALGCIITIYELMAAAQILYVAQQVFANSRIDVNSRHRTERQIN